jgi:myo-inositol 2-dehydrogenase / D-chiro-inositol 1-dehydrogenase
VADALRLGLIGSGWMGAFHAESVVMRVPGAELTAVADPAPGAADALTDRLGGTPYRDAADLLQDGRVDAVMIASPARFHTDLVAAAAAAGKGVFVEKPMALTLADADRVIAAASDANVPLQVGFNRRYAADFAAAHEVVATGGVGTPQLLRSVTRDPGLADPAAVKPWTIFFETLIHDFDTLRWLNPGAEVAEVFAVADALVRPDFKDRGLLDTAVVTLRFDNGAIGVAEANFSASYGYDVRGEVFGSAGMVTAGDLAATAMRHYHAGGASIAMTRLNVELFRAAYTAELVSFVDAVRSGVVTGPSGQDARAALAIALACVESVQANRPVRVASAAVSA